jgi:hypothetical protein
MQLRLVAHRHEYRLSVLVAKKDRILRLMVSLLAMPPLCRSIELCSIKGTLVSSFLHHSPSPFTTFEPIPILQCQSTMKFTALISSLFALGLSTVTLADSLSYDQGYDNKLGSVSNTACSDGSNGLAKKYPTFDDLPNYP